MAGRWDNAMGVWECYGYGSVKGLVVGAKWCWMFWYAGEVRGGGNMGVTLGVGSCWLGNI